MKFDYGDWSGQINGECSMEIVVDEKGDPHAWITVWHCDGGIIAEIRTPAFASRPDPMKVEVTDE